MDDPASSPPQFRRFRWPTMLLAVMLVVGLALAYVWFWLSPRVPGGPIRLVRDASGSLVPVEPSDKPSGVSWEGQAARITANNSLTSACATFHNEDGRVLCSRVLIMNRSEHLLMARVGPLLQEKLKSLGYVRQIDYYPAGSSPEPGTLGPDVTITLDLADLTEKKWPTSHSVDATILVTACNGPPGCRNLYSDLLTPPIVQFDWDGKLHHVSTTTGLVSSAAKYKLEAEDIAKQIAEALTKEFNSRREKLGTLPDPPPAFFPPYRPAPALPLAELGQLTMVTSWHGPFSHNETLWRLTADRPPNELLDELQRRLQTAGWKGSHGSNRPDRSFLRMENRQWAVLSAYVPGSQWTAPNSQPKQSFLWIHYVDRMNRDELRAAVDQVLSQDLSIDLLLCLHHHWSEEQSQRILKVLQSRPGRTPQMSLALVNLYRRLGQKDKALAELLRARALLRTAAQPADFEDKLKNLAKELGDEKLAEKPIELETLKELGFFELKAGVPMPSREIGLDEPVHFYGKTAKGSLQIVSVCVVKADCSSGQPSYALTHVESGEHGRSWSKGGTSHTFSVDGVCRGNFTIERLGSAERFRLNVQVSAP